MTIRIFFLVLSSLVIALSSGCRTSNPALGLYNQDFQETIRAASTKVFPAVVYIRVVSANLSSGKDEGNIVSGSGVIISPDGEILTNHHVIDKAREIRCQLYDGTSYRATVLGSDKDLDIALLKLALPENSEPLPNAILSPATVNEGDFVMAMGAPWGLARSVSIGIISCSRRYLDSHGKYSLWYQTDASISPGNSGGPLVNTAGEVIGINTLATLIGGTMGFTVPATVIQSVLARLRQYGEANWAWLGLELQPLHDFDRNITFDYDHGVMVAGTLPGSPARKAGIQPNDRITALNGERLTAPQSEDIPDINRRLGLLPFEVPVSFTVWRNDQQQEITITPIPKGKAEGDEIAFPRWGFTAKVINRFDNPGLYFYSRKGGVFVYGIDSDGNAAESNLNEQDVISTVAGKELNSLSDLEKIYAEALQNIHRQHFLIFGIIRNGREMQVAIDFRNEKNK
ncbi:MAG: PDZ domain-containing protein [Lentisphaerae bacterium]|nr:PDZ domain-containing protein [Lentisphaerota bacterium]